MLSGDLSTAIGDIYDATIDRSLWVSVLGKCAQFLVGSAEALFSKDAASKTGNAVHYYGIDPYFERLYFEKISKLDPLTVGHYFAEIGEPVSVADIMPYEEFLETRAYREWGQPQGIVDTLNVALDKTATSAAFFAIFRHERHGRVDDEMRQCMRFIIPHLRRSVLIGRVIDLKTAEAAMFSDSLDCIRDGILLVNERGRIVHANANGHTLLAEGSLLRADGGKLVITAATYAAVATLFVRRAALEVPSPPEIIAKTYKLTPTELQVLLAIVEVGGVPETAVALGVAETTVKAHLRRLFDKTSSSRQADLVKLVAGFSSPLRY